MDEKDPRGPIEFLEDWVSILCDGDCMSPEDLVKDAHKSFIMYLEGRDKRPLCPDCNAVMVKNHLDDFQEPGRKTIWLCERNH